jgi:hypothetical protein
MKWSIFLIICVLVVSSAQIDSAQTNDAKKPVPSLDELARQQKAEKAKSAAEPINIFTNDDLLGATPPAAAGSRPSVQPSKTEPTRSSVGAGHESAAENLYRQKMIKLRNQLETDQRSLRKLKEATGGKAQAGVYRGSPSANPAILPQFIRGSPNKSTVVLDRAEKRIESDQKAISDLEEQCRRDKDCGPGWLR